jgi:hypothetical protein
VGNGENVLVSVAIVALNRRMANVLIDAGVIVDPTPELGEH